MTPPPGWTEDPVVDAGFAAAYAEPPRPGVPAAEAPVVDVPSQPSSPDELAHLADLASRRTTPDGRRLRAPDPGRLSPGRAVAGAAVSVAGVCLGIGTLLWVSDDPSQGPGPVVSGPPEAAAPLVAEAPVEDEVVPVDPPAPAAVAPIAPVAPSPAAAAPPAAAVPRPAPRVVPITVLNNSNRTGLADRAARRFERGGWPVRLTGNFRGQIPVTTVYYDPGLESEARAFARDFDGIARVRPRFATLPARGVVVVLTREFTA